MNEDENGVQSFYEEATDYYAEDFVSAPIREHFEWPAVRSLLPDLDGTRVLDAACGPETYAKRMADAGADVLGVDGSRAMIDEAERRFGDDATFRRADLAEPLAFVADGEFDAVVSQLTLELFEEWGPILEEFARVLGDDGTLVLSTHHPFHEFLAVRDDEYGYSPELYGVGSAPDVEPERTPPRYHDVERYTERGSGVSVSFYRRPLADVIQPVLDAGFAVTDLVEPEPTEKFEARRPDACERLRRRPPDFLCLRAER